MGSSHSYLQNLELTATTPLHLLHDGLCLEFAIPDGMVNKAMSLGGIAGPCSMTAYTQMDKTYTVKSPMGDLSMGVWQIPQTANTVEPDWTNWATELAKFKVAAPVAMPAMPVINTTVMPELMNLNMADVKVMHLADWCLDNDSAKAMEICNKKATPGPHGGEYTWEERHCETAMEKATNAYCTDHEAWKSAMMI